MTIQFLKKLVVSACLLVTIAGGAQAQLAAPADQTRAGDVVTNTITLTYSGADGTITLPTLPEHNATFTVARRIDLSVTPQAGSEQLAVAPGTAAATMEFILRNLGNPNEEDMPQDFHIDVTAIGNLFDGNDPLTFTTDETPASGQFNVRVGGEIYDIATPTAVSLASGAEATIRITAHIPLTAGDSASDMFSVTAVAVDGGTKVAQVRNADLDLLSTVYADAASTTTLTGDDVPFVGPAPQIDAGFNGEARALTRLQVTAPRLSATKTAVVLDEMLTGSGFNCTNGGAATGSPLAAIPGACVEYTITVTNDASASAAATNISISDAIPANTTYAGSTGGDFAITENGSPVTSITAALTTLAAGASRSFTLRVTVD